MSRGWLRRGWLPASAGLLLRGAILLLPVALSAAPTHEIVAAFQAPPTYPTAELVADGQGFLWGTSQYGGTYGLGSIYKVRPDGSDFTVVISFAGTTTAPRGSQPVAALVAGPGGFYGTTSFGGLDDHGTIFRVAPDGTLTTLVQFTGTENPFRGASPAGALVLGPDGTTFYGTSGSGAFDSGTVFSVTSGGAFTTLVDFDFSNGAYPFGALVRGADGLFYGTTQLGGNNGFGTVYKITAAGVLTTLVHFANAAAPRGAYPQAGLVRGAVDGQFFGTTYSGGTADKGTVFRLTHDGTNTTLATLADFTGTTGAIRGAFPDGLLARGSGTLLLGTTYGGGTADKGTVFSITEAGSFNPLVSFTNTSGGVRGGFPQGGVVALGDGTYAGATTTGGVANNGTVFRVDEAGTLATISELAHGGGANRGLAPSGGLVANGSGGFLGTTAQGGTLGQGTIFEVDLAGLATTRIDLTDNGVGNRGASPFSALAPAAGGEFVGTTYAGGLNGLGTVFRLSAAGTLTTQVDLTGTAGANRGANPQAGLVLASDGNFYGVASVGGSLNFGTLFRQTPAGAMTALVDFTRNGASNRGSSPLGALLDDGAGTLYGTTHDGGAGGFGTVFKSTYAGALTTLVEFTSAGASNRGAFPVGALLKAADGNLYGTTRRGGAGAFGTVFRLTTAGVLTTLVEFTSNGASNRGAFPLAGLAQTPDGQFFGLTQQGGGRDLGTLFRYTGSGAVSTVLEFTGPGAQSLSGASPGYGALLLAADGNLYGTTAAGGPGGGGTVFRLRFGPRPTTLAATDLTGSSATLRGTLNPNGPASTAYFEWGTSPALLNNSTPSQPISAGTATVAVSAPLAGLAVGTTYYFRLRGENSEQYLPQRGQVVSFQTPGTNHAPTAGSIAYGTMFGQPLSIAVSRLLAVGSDVDGDALSVPAVAAASAAGGAVSLAGATITYTPPPGFTGGDSFTYTLSDGHGGTAPGTVQVTVLPAGQPLGIISAVTFNGPSSTSLSATGLPGVGYIAQSSDDLLSWADISPLTVAAGNGGLAFTDLRARPARRFFRLLAAP